MFHKNKKKDMQNMKYGRSRFIYVDLYIGLPVCVACIQNEIDLDSTCTHMYRYRYM